MKKNFTKREGALGGVEAFLAVAHHLSFTKAATELGVSTSAIGQTIRTIEQRLGSPLFLRTTRSVGLTEAGQRFLARVAPAFEELVAAAEEVHELGGRPSGRLRIAISRGAYAVYLRPLVASFCSQYPEIELEVAASEQAVDLAREGFDAAIRFGRLVAPDMIAIRLTSPFRMLPAAAPTYLAARGAPRVLSDLAGHACLRMRRDDGGLAPWRLVEDGREIELVVQGPFIGHDYGTLRDAAIDGVGIALAPEPMMIDELSAGRLVPVLDRFAQQFPGLFLCYLGRRQAMPKLRAFIEHVRKHTKVDDIVS